MQGVFLAALVYMAMGGGASALSFKCIEPSRYKNLLQIFDDNPAQLSSYFGLGTQLPDMNACRAVVVTGTIGDGDGAALINTIIQNKGWLDVLYLSFDGVHLLEEIKLAHIIRAFWLKTRVSQAVPVRYSPDFAAVWGPAAARENPASAATISELSPLNNGLKAFAKRSDLGLAIVADHNICIESCAGTWMSGVHRQTLPPPAVAVRPSAAEAALEIVTARPRILLAASLDSGKIVAPNDRSWRAAIVAGAAPVIPQAVDRTVRDKCAAELVAGEALEGRVAGAGDDLARTDFRGVRSTPPALLAQFDSLRMAGVRLQQCVARAFESERLASFRRLCGPGCDKTKLIESFDRTASAFVEKTFSVANILGASQSDRIGREWREEEATGPGTWTRREKTNVFDAAWNSSDGRRVAATIEIGRIADRIAMVRTQSEGRCVYQGRVAADDKFAQGTYTCSWAPGAYAWSATITE